MFEANASAGGSVMLPAGKPLSATKFIFTVSSQSSLIPTTSGNLTLSSWGAVSPADLLRLPLRNSAIT